MTGILRSFKVLILSLLNTRQLDFFANNVNLLFMCQSANAKTFLSKCMSDTYSYDDSNQIKLKKSKLF